MEVKTTAQAARRPGKGNYTRRVKACAVEGGSRAVSEHKALAQRATACHLSNTHRGCCCCKCKNSGRGTTRKHDGKSESTPAFKITKTNTGTHSAPASKWPPHANLRNASTLQM